MKSLNLSDPSWQFLTGSRDVCDVLLGGVKGHHAQDVSALHGLQGLGVVVWCLVLFLQLRSLLIGFQETFGLDNLACVVA